MRIGARDARLGDDTSFRLSARLWLRSGLQIAGLAALDLTAIGIVLGTLDVASGLTSSPALSPDAPVAVLFTYAVLLSLAAVGAYRAGDERSSVPRTLTAVAVGGAVLPVVVRLADWQVPWTALALLTGGALVAVPELRLVGDRLQRFLRLRRRRPERILLIGSPDDIEQGALHAPGGGEVVARIAVRDAASGVGGRTGDLADALNRLDADRVVVTRPLAPGTMDAVVAAAFGREMRVEAWLGADAGACFRPAIRREGGRLVLECHPARAGVPRMAIKRAFDVAFAMSAFVLASPLLALIALAIRLDSPGPVFFGQTRVGVGGEPFRLWKFRTMIADADRMKPVLAELNETGDPRLFKISRDPRVTRIGHWLRRTSLDELPQLFNVVRGEMSLVGPRPFFPEDVEFYESHHFERLTVLPGITGLWQVSGRSDITDFEDVVRLDREYIRRWSIRLDLAILLKTIPAVLRRNGAY